MAPDLDSTELQQLLNDCKLPDTDDPYATALALQMQLREHNLHVSLLMPDCVLSVGGNPSALTPHFVVDPAQVLAGRRPQLGSIKRAASAAAAAAAGDSAAHER